MASVERELKLLGTSGCHLCELAEGVLAGLLAEGLPWQIELVDIAEHDDLLERYATAIPVLLAEDLEEALCWPFSREQVLEWLA